MYSINNISVSFSGEPLFRDVSFIINAKDRLGLVGKNGSGKTSLMRVITGRLGSDSGEIVIPHNKKVGFLEQEMELNNQHSVMEEALSAFEEIKQKEADIKHMSDQLTERTDYDTASYNKLVENLSDANDVFQIMGGHSMEADAEKVLYGLGFERDDFKRPLNEFSYGWQMRVEIAKILLRKPELLLLDEPTNHLDIESIQWLEDFLINYPGAVVLVSHDRAFLDNVSNRTIEIELGRIYDYKVSYSHYVELREQRLEQQLATYSNQQRQIKQVERFIERFRYKNTKSSQVQSRVKMLEKMDEVEIDAFDQSSIHFTFPEAQPSGKVVVEAKQMSKSYGEHLVLENIDFSILKGDRVAFVGRNGEGKTTLSKVITGELDYDGNLGMGYNVSLGYFAQNQNETLDTDLTVFQTIDNIATGDMRTRVRAILGAFLFSGDDIDKRVKVLSGGEKARLALAKLLLTPANLLVLDEPTNHLDMRSKDILKNALLQFKGTLIIVSHDRDFLQGLTNKLFEFRNKKVREHLGDIYDFLSRRSLENLKQLEEVKAKNSSSNDKNTSDNKLNYERKKQLERDIRKIRNQVQASEKTIDKLEKELEAINQKLASPDPEENHSSDTSIFTLYEATKNQLESEMNRWEEMQMQLELFEGERKEFN